MKIYNWADLMELSKREVMLPTKGSHHDLVFILIGKKKILCKEACKCCCEKRLTIKEKGEEKKKESLGGLFLQRIIAEVTDNTVHKETANLG